MSLGKKISRLTQMSGEELRTRVHQAFNKHADTMRYRLGGKFAVPMGDLAKQGKFFFSPQDVPAITQAISARIPDGVKELVAYADRICAHRFDLLGYTGLDYGQEIHWHTDVVNGVTAPPKPWHRISYLEFAEVGDAKVTWELNRHQHLSVLARAHLHTKEHKYVDELQTQWHSWQRANPYPIGVNWASSLELAFRSMSWVWVLNLLSNGELPEEFRREIIASLALHARNIEKYLSTYFSANTHLLGEAVSLMFIGTLFPQMRDAQRWSQLGWDLILEHARRKVLPDGAYFEQSTYYHVYALDMFLHARILAARSDKRVPPELDETICKMLEFLAALHSGGVSPRFGDDDGGRWFDGRRNRVEHLQDPLCIGAAFYDEPRFKITGANPTEELCWLLGKETFEKFESLNVRPASDAAQSFPATGTYVLTNAQGTVLSIDAGPLGGDSGGHGHADALSVNLTVDGETVLVDPGTYQYVGKDDARTRFRTTAMHNTLTVKGASQVKPTGPFSWEELPHSSAELISGDAFDLFLGSQGGHKRIVFNLKGNYFFVIDGVSGGEEPVDVRWHLPPEYSTGFTNPAAALIKSPLGISLGIVSGDGVRLSREDYEFSPAYGSRQTATVLCQRSQGVRPVMLLQPHGRNTEIASVRSLDVTSLGVYAYEIQLGGIADIFVYAKGETAKSWRSSEVESDADFLYFRRDECGKIISIIAHNGSWAKWKGKDIFRTQQAEPVFESGSVPISRDARADS